MKMLTVCSDCTAVQTHLLDCVILTSLPFWPGDLRQYGSAVTHPAPSHWTQGPPKDVCWAPSSSLCWPTTAHRHNSNRFIKFADDMTVVGLISNRDETNYRSEVSRLAGWCSDNNLSLNVEKTKEIVVDFRRVHSLHAPLTINGATVERVSSTKFLGVHITEDLSWTNNTAALAKKAQQRLYFLRKLRRARAPAPIMCTFYRGTIETILTSCITVWYGACNASCHKSLQRIVRAAEKIVGVSLPSLQDIYNTRLTRKALSIAGDPTHPTHNFFSLLPSGRRLRSLQARTNRLKDSFIHQAVRKLNSLPSLPPPPLPSLTPCNTELWPPPHHHHHPNTHTHSHWDKHRTLVQHWTDLIQLPLLTVWIKKTAPCHFK